MARHYQKRPKLPAETPGNAGAANQRSGAHDIGLCSNGERACVLAAHSWYVLTRISVGLLEARNAGRAFENPRSADGSKPTRCVIGFQHFVELVGQTFTAADARIVGVAWSDIWQLLAHHGITSDWPGHGVTTFVEIDTTKLAKTIKGAVATKARAAEIAERNVKAYHIQHKGNDKSGLPPTAPDFAGWYSAASKSKKHVQRKGRMDIDHPNKDRPSMFR
jgi:hypothetical protein